MAVGMCSVDGCAKQTGVPGTARGLCSMHYTRLMKRGTLADPRPQVPWSKGLTVDDPRIRRGVEAMRRTLIGSRPWNAGQTVATSPQLAAMEAKRRASRVYENKGGRRATLVRYQRTAKGRAQVLVSASRRRARLVGNGGSHTAQEWREKLSLFGGCCAYCGRDDGVLVREHRVPLARGGTDDITNIVPACATCNARKGTRTDREFLARVA